MNAPKSLEQLENLHHLVADSRKGYQDAGNKVKDHAIAGYLLQLSQEREAMRSELAQMIARCPETNRPLQDGTLEGHLHRAWIDIRLALALASDDAILAECERGESYLLACYAEVIESHIQPSDVQRLLIQQRVIVRDSLLSMQQNNRNVGWSIM